MIITTPIAIVAPSIIIACSIGRIGVVCNRFGISSSLPKKLPYTNPNTTPLSPTHPIIPARSIFLTLYSIKPRIAKTALCPTSPNIIPKNSIYVTAKIGVGSISL